MTGVQTCALPISPGSCPRHFCKSPSPPPSYGLPCIVPPSGHLFAFGYCLLRLLVVSPCAAPPLGLHTLPHSGRNSYRAESELSENFYFASTQKHLSIYTFPLLFREGSHSVNRPYPPPGTPKRPETAGGCGYAGQTCPPRLKMYPRADPWPKSSQILALPRFTGRCEPSGRRYTPPLFILHLFLHPNSSPRPTFCRSVTLPQFTHTRATRGFWGSRGRWLPCSGKWHTGLHKGNRVASFASALSLFSAPQFLRRSLFVDGGAIRKLRKCQVIFAKKL